MRNEGNLDSLEVQHYCEKIVEAQDIIATLRKDLADRQATLATIGVASCQSLSNPNSEPRHSRNLSNLALEPQEDLNAQYMEAQQQLDHLCQESQAVEHVNEELEQEIEKKKLQQTMLAEEISRSKQQMTELQAQVASKQKSLEELCMRNELEAMSRESMQRQARQQEIKALEDQVKDQTQEICRLSEAITALEHEEPQTLTELEEQLSQLQQQLAAHNNPIIEAPCLTDVLAQLLSDRAQCVIEDTESLSASSRVRIVMGEHVVALRADDMDFEQVYRDCYTMTVNELQNIEGDLHWNPEPTLPIAEPQPVKLDRQCCILF